MPRIRSLRSPLAVAVLGAAAFVTLTLVPAQASRTLAPRGSLIIVGGGGRPASVLDRFLELGGGRGQVKVAVIPLASEDAEESGRYSAAAFDSAGAKVVVVLSRPEDARSPEVVRQLESATAVWFGGGDQVKLTAALAGTPALEAIKRRFREGAVVGGTSAGAAIMSDTMITGHQTPPGDTTGYYGDDYPAIARGRIEIKPGFGFLPTAIVDQHFIRRERHNRLMSAVLEHPKLLGVGIDEATALEVQPSGTWRVLGRSAVVVYDARQSSITPTNSAVLGALELRVHVLPTGSVFDPSTGRGRFPQR
jgi:cyanophycinase